MPAAGQAGRLARQDGGERPWRVDKDRVVVRVRATPKSAREAIDGLETTAEGPALKVRVRAVPQDGAANQAIAALLAEWLDVPKRAVALTSGGKSRVKSFEIVGDTGQIVSVLAARTAALSGPSKDS